MQLTRLARRALTRVRNSAVVRDASHVAAALLIVGAAACTSDDGPITPPQTPAIALTLGVATVTASPGTPATVPVALVRSGGFTGDVAIAIEGLPTGVTGVAAPLVMGAGVVASSITLTVGPTAVPGISTITVRGIGNGVTASSAIVQITVSIPPAITLTAGSATVSAPQNGSQTVGLTIDRAGGFTGAVTLAAEGLPAGVIPTFTPASLASGVTSGTLKLDVGPSVALGTTAVTIRASGAGITDKTVVVQLTVTASTIPDITLTAAPAAISVLSGASVSTAINIARSGNFAGNVALTTSALPAGVTATFTPQPATANTSTLAFATTTAVVPGVYTVTVTGAATGLTSRTVNVVLTVNAPPGVSVALTPAAATVVAGASTQTSVAITRIGGFATDLTMTAENVPAGVTATFAPATISNAPSTLTLATTTAAVPGVYTINVRATGAGNVTAIAPFTLTVGAVQGFSVALTPASATIAAGSVGTLTANITRSGGFTGTVNFTVTGLPAGITAVVNPAAAAGATTALSLTVAGSVAVGQYTGTLTGTATGFANSVTTFTVNVTAVGSGGGNVSWAFCDATRIPVFFAFRDGASGSWTPVTPNGSNVFSFTLNQSVGGVAYVLPNGSGFATSVYLQTAAEMQATANNECVSFPTGKKTLTGSVTGLAPTTGIATQSASMTLGNSTASATVGGPNFTLNNVNPGALDLIAVRTTTNFAPFSLVPDGIIIRRGLNLATGSAITPALNFGAGGESVAPVSATLTVSNAGTDILSVISQFGTANGTLVSLGFPSTVGAATIYGVPTASLIAGDLHRALVAASADAQGTNVRSAYMFFRDMANKTVALGPVLNAPTVAAVFNTVLRPRVQGAFQTEYQTGIGASYTQNATNRAVTVTASKGYFSNAANYDLDTPDLSGVNGFQPTWGLSNGFTTTYQLSATNAPATAPVDGTQYLFASRSGTVPPAALRR